MLKLKCHAFERFPVLKILNQYAVVDTTPIDCTNLSSIFVHLNNNMYRRCVCLSVCVFVGVGVGVGGWGKVAKSRLNYVGSRF